MIFVMTYPISFRRKVLAHIEEGMSKREAARLFKISPNTLYQWLNADDLHPRNNVVRHRKIDKAALVRHIEDYPDLYLRERAAHFGVHLSSMGHALAKLNIRKKKSGDI
jgi:transposase